MSTLTNVVAHPSPAHCPGGWSALVFDPAPDPPAIITDEVMAKVKEQSSWIEVLKAYGEHLSDSELLVIRQQLSRDPA